MAGSRLRPHNRRVFTQRWQSGGSSPTWESYYFWGVDGKKVSECTPQINSGYPVNIPLQITCYTSDVYFAGRLVVRSGAVMRTGTDGWVGGSALSVW